MVCECVETAGAKSAHVTIDELFVEPPDRVRHGPAARNRNFPGRRYLARWTRFCAGRSLIFPKSLRKRAIEKAVAFVEERLNGEAGSARSFPRWPIRR